MCAQGLVNFGSPGALGVIRWVLFGKRPSWAEASKQVLAGHQPLWEALANV